MAPEKIICPMIFHLDPNRPINQPGEIVPFAPDDYAMPFG
jgi:hypothetical protein